MMNRSITIVTSLSLFVFGISYSQTKLGGIFHSVKNNVNTVKQDVNSVKSDVNVIKPQNTKKDDEVKPQEGDTTKRTTTTNPDGTTKNIAIGDQGSNNNDKKGAQIKDFTKENKDNGSKEKPFNTGTGTTPTSNLAIGDQGTVEDKKDNSTKNNNNVQQNPVNPK